MLPSIDPHDQHTIDTVAWLALVSLFALFGASARMLLEWRPTPWTNRIGRLMVSVFSAWLAWLLGWSYFEHYAPYVFIGIAIATWTGNEFVDLVARRWLREMGRANGVLRK